MIEWKTGARIGLFYGILGMVYFGFLLWFNSQPNPPGQPVMDDPAGIGMKLFVIGVLVFLPLFCLSFITATVFSPFIPVNSNLFFIIATMPVYGLLLGAAVGHFFGWREKARKKIMGGIIV